MFWLLTVIWAPLIGLPNVSAIWPIIAPLVAARNVPAMAPDALISPNPKFWPHPPPVVLELAVCSIRCRIDWAVAFGVVMPTKPARAETKGVAMDVPEAERSLMARKSNTWET